MSRDHHPKQQQEEEDPLKKQFRILVQDWNTYLESAPRHRRSRSASNRPPPPHEDDILGLGLLDSSPKTLLTSLQQRRPACSIEQRAAARAGCRVIEGRSLLEALERAKDDDVGGNASPVCSVCSSVLIQESGSGSGSGSGLGSGSGSLSSFRGLDSSSSSTSKGRRRSEEGRWAARAIWVFVAAWTAAMGVILATVGFWGGDEYGECMTPT